MSKIAIRITLLLLFVGATAASVVTVTACGEGECLVSGENCSASYKESAYGTSDIYCCGSLNCTENHLGDFVCR